MMDCTIFLCNKDCLVRTCDSGHSTMGRKLVFLAAHLSLASNQSSDGRLDTPIPLKNLEEYIEEK